MTYQEFSDKFLVTLASAYRNGTLDLHALIDFNLWKRVFPEEYGNHLRVQWNKISFNAFTLSDSTNSLLLVYKIPEAFKHREAGFIGIRLDNNRKDLYYYSLRHPQYHDEPWMIYQYDFKKSQNIFIEDIHGTNSMREFKASIERMPCQEPTFFQRINDYIHN